MIRPSFDLEGCDERPCYPICVSHTVEKSNARKKENFGDGHALIGLGELREVTEESSHNNGRGT